MIAGKGRRVSLKLTALGAIGALAAAFAWGGPGGPAGAFAQAEGDRYDLVHGCYGLRSLSDGDYLAKAGNNYAATAAAVGDAEPFRMQATDLGKYLLYGGSGDFLAISKADPLPVLGGIVSDAKASNRADWTVDGDAGAFTIVNESQGKALGVNAAGQVRPVAPGNAGEFAFTETDGCATYPEVDVSATGDPATGSPSYGEVSGLVEGHLHGMAYEFLGGEAHCGQPWHRFGVEFALRDCEDHEVGNGCAAVLENVLFGNPARCHDPVGWPTFADWPHPESLTHEQTYYKWLERAWMGGLRVYVNLMVENRVLCEVYPEQPLQPGTKNNCDEMQSVELQNRRIEQLEDYIDAQSGGPGEGWFRIVNTPFEARRVINQGKLAVVKGMEVSEPFGCRLYQPAGQASEPQCDRSDIDVWLDRLDEMDIRQLEIVNKFDNALTGVAGDDGSTGTVVNSANAAPPPLNTGSFWDMESCEDPENHDHTPTAVESPHNDDMVIANGLAALGGPAPVYPEPPLCNQLGLSNLGKHAVEKIMSKRMIFDPDHMSVLARDAAMKLLEKQRYSGVISSHSWSTENTLPRIYKLGGMITPYAGSSESFVHQWAHLQDIKGRLKKQYYGVGYGADMNGFGSQGLPRGAGVPNPVTYPFESFDGAVTLDRQTSGQREFDINTDGVAHYGLYPDWVEDLRMLAGDQIVEDMGRGAEAYLQMWERADGITHVRCSGWQKHNFTSTGLGTRMQLAGTPRETLEGAGQPVRRTSTWLWCMRRAQLDEKNVAAVFGDDGRVALLTSQVGRNRADGVGTNDPARRLGHGFAEPLGDGLWLRGTGGGNAFVYGTESGRVSFAGVATGTVAATEETLREYLGRAGLG